MRATAPPPRRNPGFAHWWRYIVAAVIAIFGVPIALGGLWLISLGGSWYYFPAGLGLLATAFLLARADRRAVWLYAAIFVATVIWALWEAGFNGWAQVPRLIAPAVVMLLVLSTLPTLRGPRLPRAAMATGGVALSVAAALAMVDRGPETALAQVAPTAPAPNVPAPTVPAAPIAAPEAAPVQFTMPTAGAD